LPPGTICTFFVRGLRIVDLSGGFDPERWPRLWADFAVDWRSEWFGKSVEPPTWHMADDALAAECDGILFPSQARHGGTNLVVYRSSGRPASQPRLRSGRRAEEDRNAEADGLRHNLCSDIDGFSLQAAKRRSSCAATWPAKRERPLRGDHSGTANVRSGSRAAPRSWIRVALNLPLKADLHTADGHQHIVRAIGSRSRPAASLTVDFIAAGEEAPVRSQEHTAEHNATTSSPA
jgi:hypothetical protein